MKCSIGATQLGQSFSTIRRAYSLQKPSALYGTRSSLSTLDHIESSLSHRISFRYFLFYAPFYDWGFQVFFSFLVLRVKVCIDFTWRILVNTHKRSTIKGI
jgi:hypothetical protein